MIKLGPGLVEDAVAYITANVQAHLTAEEVIWADGIELPPPNKIVRRDPDQPQKISNPPYLYVFVDGTTIYDDHSGMMMSVHTLILWLVAQNADPEKLRVMVGRYGNALYKLLSAYDMSGAPYRLAEPQPGGMPNIDFGMTLTNGTMAMNDVRIETRWTVREG